MKHLLAETFKVHFNADGKLVAGSPKTSRLSANKPYVLVKLASHPENIQRLFKQARRERRDAERKLMNSSDRVYAGATMSLAQLMARPFSTAR